MEYFELSESITNGTLFERPSANRLEYGRYKRTPGFPLLLKLGQLFAPDNPINALRVNHTVIAILGLGITVFALSYSFPLSFVALALCLPMLKMERFFTGFMSEWSAFNIVLILFSLAYCCLRKRSLFWVFCLSLAHGILLLVHPSFLTTYPLSWIFALLVFRGQRWRAFALLIAGATPVIFWCSINLGRLGYFTLTPYGDMATFSMFSILGRAEIVEGDSALFKRFVAKVSHETEIASDDDLLEATNFTHQPELLRLYLQKNAVVDAFGADENWTMVERKKILSTYGTRALQSSLKRYLRFLYHGALGMYRSWAIVAPALILLIVLWKKQRKHQTLGAALCFLLALHFCHILTVIAVTPAPGRYYAMTFYPLLFGLILAISRFGLDTLPGPKNLAATAR